MRPLAGSSHPVTASRSAAPRAGRLLLGLRPRLHLDLPWVFPCQATGGPAKRKRFVCAGDKTYESYKEYISWH